MLVESLVRSGLACGLLLLAVRVALAPSGITPLQADNNSMRDYWRLVMLGLCLGLAFAFDWVWVSWLFIFLIYLKGRKWLPIHKFAGHSLFWLGYGVGVGALFSFCGLLRLDLWVRSSQPQAFFWLWLVSALSLLLFVGDKLNRLRRQIASYWQLAQHELILMALLLFGILTASYFDITRLLTIIPALLVCYRPFFILRYQNQS